MGLRRRQPPPCACEQLAQRLAEAEAAIAALSRAVIHGGLAPDIIALPANRRLDNRADAAVIRAAAASRR
jgi:hypothetical protein